MQTVNYDPLLPLESARQARREGLVLQGKRTRGRLVLPWPAIIIAAGAVVVFGLVWGTSVSPLWAAVPTGVIFWIALAGRMGRRRKAARAFAQANGWRSDVDMQNRPPVPSGVLPLSYREGVSGELDGTPFWLYTCSRKVRAAGGDAQILALRFDKPLPTFCLDATADGFDSSFGLPDARRVELEGDFGATFRLYTTADAQAAVFVLLTPDLMQTLVDRSAYINVLAEGEYLYLVNVIAPWLTHTYTHNLFDCAQELIPRVRRKLDTSDKPAVG